MAKGQFSALQNAHIASFFPDFVKEMDKGVTGAGLTRWKQTTASNILDSPLFLNLDIVKFKRQTWYEMVVRKFTNYRNQVYLKSEDAHRRTLTVAQLKKANPLLKFSSLKTGRELFALDHHDTITHTAKQRALDTNSNSPAGVYQTVLKEHWDALSSDEQGHWNDLAEAQGGDIGNNQREFATNLTLALRDLCQGRLLGDAEMVLFYGFREPNGGDLIAGTIQAHSAHNHIHFGGTPEELELHHGKAWADFAERVIPRPVISNPLLPRNSNNEPVFPLIAIDTVPIADMRMLLTDYFNECWVDQNPGIEVPWEAITSDPAKYYNTSETYFSIKLDHPQNLSIVQTLTLVEGLLATSVMSIPDTPRTTPIPSRTVTPVPSRSATPEIPEPPSPPCAQIPQASVQDPTVPKPQRKRKAAAAANPKAIKKSKSEVDTVPVPRKSERAKKAKNDTDTTPKTKPTTARKAAGKRWDYVDEDGNKIDKEGNRLL
ncbi:hypothetical protein C8F04DRAFT_1255924 [Mycena alexandri]|uniref:Uncharacterized protein n=1 Tax=Mycena alexandri TaxID=1745969 RepID=A0AAD6T3H6_9AGAR|nr:hypothetical protein C8F04DRAFT_1255924 [Mycena alexandri]